MRLSAKFTEFIRSHLILSVVLAICAGWFLISWLVFLAERHAPDASITSYGEALWWGVVTLLTVGYGDLVPVTVAGKVLASVLMFSGIFGVAITTSKFSSYFLQQVLLEGKGVVNTSKLRDHFIVCGWKEEMQELLSHILAFNPGLKPSDLVLVANLSDPVAESLRAEPGMKGLHIIQGEYYQAAILKRAAPERAKKVLILGDRAPTASGSIPSMTEVDARTIMTAMTLSSIARGTLVAAEVLDPKMDQYLKLASVSEIIYSREYSRLLLGNASGGTGISNIIFDLLDPKNPTLIATHPIAEAAVGETYPEFKELFEKAHPKCIVIGILENTGNSHTIKELALRQAQRTPDVGRLVENLKSVKELRCNHPIFNPGSGYSIPAGAMAIVIETRPASGGGENEASLRAS